MRLLIIELKFENNNIEIYLNNGERFNLPKYYSKRIKYANFEDLKDYKLIKNGEGIHFKKIDEDISLETLIQELNIF